MNSRGGGIRQEDSSGSAVAPAGSRAIVGARLIDGTGRPPIDDSAVVVRDGRIGACGPRGVVEIPSDAEVIPASGKVLTPGFVDTNFHLTPVWTVEQLIRDRERCADIALETAQLALRAGVTTIRDSYGSLVPLLATRDAIARGDVVGPRVHVAGNIVGWGGPRSMTFEARGHSQYFRDRPGLMDATTTYLIETIQDEITQGVGEELIAMEPRELASAINAYLDKGVDFVKFGGTTHGVTPSLIVFSQRAQETIVEQVHRRGKVVETHSTSPEGLRISILAGVDLVQHPEILDVEMSDELAELVRSSGVICSMNVPRWTGRDWTDFIEEREKYEKTRPNLGRPLTGTERRLERYWQSKESWRLSAKRLIEAGCKISTASDCTTLPPAGLMRGDEPRSLKAVYSPGEGTLLAVEGLVEIGMSPMAALVSATKHGAMASRALDEYGSIEAGKSADILLLDGDPLEDIHNIRRLSMVMAKGQVIDTSSLPTAPVYSATSRTQ
jgi:imidazolonepropionase-like amidohydrolase